MIVNFEFLNHQQMTLDIDATYDQVVETTDRCYLQVTVEGDALRVNVIVHPDATQEQYQSLPEWIGQRLTRMFNPDGSEPDLWSPKADGSGFYIWGRVIIGPPDPFA